MNTLFDKDAVTVVEDSFCRTAAHEPLKDKDCTTRCVVASPRLVGIGLDRRHKTKDENRQKAMSWRCPFRDGRNTPPDQSKRLVAVCCKVRCRSIDRHAKVKGFHAGKVVPSGQKVQRNLIVFWYQSSCYQRFAAAREPIFG